jgi:UDP-N-acetylmuramyl-tripeptide synthetase
MGFRTIVKKFIPKGFFSKIEPYGHLAEAVLFNALSGFPARKLKVIGVTGTDGKTTTSMLIAQMLRHNGYKVGLITTVAVDYGDGKGEQPNPSHQTTASAKQLTSMIKTMKNNGVEWLILETSSHSLAQHRVWSVPYSVAVFTNLSHEHLDYHKTFERYRDAKLRLFKLCAANRRGLQTGVINADDASAEWFTRASKKAITYGIKRGDMRATELQLTKDGGTFVVTTDEDEYNIKTHLAGRFNVYNVLAALGVGAALGLDKEQVEQGIESLPGVPGRMMAVSTGKDFSVFVDYAVTPEALRQVLDTAKEFAGNGGKVAIVFGATGDRDKTKRKEMGQIVGERADRVYLTDDETYTEDPQAIRDQVFEGIKNATATDRCKEIADREKAIKQALDDAKAGDVILLAGIGHQNTRNMGGKEIAWSDEEIVKKYSV